ncbi:PQQ-binding-like beta-propeller repeat protein [Streptomyces sp. UNOB3_S3]|uniref:outer membrane protein assembly factor BamB family protein n=1 Tax=Streptomyces sp. UNOB3_S3 TaxID=2871682 RepID=UPI001E57B7E4|nr:PQQ-binding-like beta-propeller repeat protein [Streptomyces sp. UNOB3_S3]MCC3779538.1 PQQ-like beta-propeller repeat protein [Streptomyces sp. UNOB3_S3]
MTQPPPLPPHGGELPPQDRAATRVDRPGTPPAPPGAVPPAGPSGAPSAGPSGAPAAGPSGASGFGPAPQPFGPAAAAMASAATVTAGAAGPRGGGKARKALAIGLGLLLAAGAGTGGWLLWGRGGNDPAPKAKGPAKAVDAKLDWMAPVPDTDKEHGLKQMAPLWFAKGNAIMTTSKAVTAYNAETGKPAWSVPVPGFACKASPKAVDGVAAVIHGKEQYDCNMLMAVDVEHGRVLWSKELTNDRGLSSNHDGSSVSIDRGLISVADTGGTPKVFAVGNGERKKPRDFGCREYGAVADRSRQLVLAQCQPFGRIFVMKTQPRSDLEKWIWKVPDGLTVQNVLSVEPALLVVGRENDSDPSDLVSLDEKGHLRSLISISAGPYDFSDCWKSDLTSCRGAVVDGDTVYLPTKSADMNADGVNVNAVVAIDLATGKKRWTAPLGGNRGNRPVAMRDGRLLVYQQATKDESGKLLSLDPADGKAADFMRLPQESNEQEFAIARSGSAYFHDGRFYLVANESLLRSTMMMAFH